VSLSIVGAVVTDSVASMWVTVALLTAAGAFVFLRQPFFRLERNAGVLIVLLAALLDQGSQYLRSDGEATSPEALAQAVQLSTVVVALTFVFFGASLLLVLYHFVLFRFALRGQRGFVITEYGACISDFRCSHTVQCPTRRGCFAELPWSADSGPCGPGGCYLDQVAAAVSRGAATTTAAHSPACRSRGRPAGHASARPAHAGRGEPPGAACGRGWPVQQHLCGTAAHPQRA
jgi:hypothetical protein